MNLQQIEEALLYGDRINGENPVLFTEGRNREKLREISRNPFYRDSIEAFCEAGEKYITEPIASLRFTHYKLFHTTGSRKEYDREYFQRRVRLNTLAVLAMIREDTRYIPALEDTLWAICDEYTWWLPAHLGVGILDPDCRHDRLIDLFAAETAFALSEICSLLEDKLAPLVVHRARKLTEDRVLEPYFNSKGSFWWESTDINWAAVCGGSVGAACLYLVKDSGRLAPVVLRLINTMKCFIDGYDEDGACKEGIRYWNYGFGFFVYFAELLRQRTAGKIDLMMGEKICEIAKFQQKCCLGCGSVVSFSDAALNLEQNQGLTHYLKTRFDEVEIPAADKHLKFPDEFDKRWAHVSRSFFWSSPDMKGDVLPDAVYFLKNSQWLISRRHIGSGCISFAAKGGHNGEPHNHNDLGNFILNINGESILTDTGMGEYTRQYFGPERYSIFCNGSQGHSVPVVNGIYQSAGREYGACVLEQTSEAGSDTFKLDIAGAYDIKSLTSLVRYFKFFKDEPQRLILRDTFCFLEEPCSVTERFVSFCEPRLLAAGKAVLEGARGKITVLYNPQILEFAVEENIFMDHKACEQKIYCLDLKVRQPDRIFSVEIEFHMHL